MRFFFAHLSFYTFSFVAVFSLEFSDFSSRATGNEMNKIQFQVKFGNFLPRDEAKKWKFQSLSMREFQEFFLSLVFFGSSLISEFWEIFKCFSVAASDSLVSAKHKIFYAQNIKLLFPLSFTLKKYVFCIASV